MAESDLSESDANALNGTTDSILDFTWPTIGNTYYTDFFRMFTILKRIIEQNPDALRVYKDAALTYGVKGGKFWNGDTEVTYTESTGQALTDSTTNYIYLTAAGVKTINTTGFPVPSVTPHIRLATILTAGGTYDHTDITNYRDEAVFAVVRGADRQKWTVAVPGGWQYDGDFLNGGLAGLDNTGDITATEASAAFAQVYNDDDTSYEPLSTSGDNGAYTAHYQLYPDAEQVNDAAYFGHTVPFCQLWFDIATAAVHGGDSITWEYWDGSSWSALAIIYDKTDDDDQDGDRSFQVDGAVTFIPPSDWASTSVNSQAAYWVRARISGATINAPTTNSVEHYTCAPADGFRAPVDAQIQNIRLSDVAVTLHTAADVKFIVMNFTKGTHSGELTFAQNKRTDAWGSLTMNCDVGDILGVLVTQDDGTNEVTNAMLELDVERI